MTVKGLWRWPATFDPAHIDHAWPAARAFLKWSRVINLTDNTDPVNEAVKLFLVAIFPGIHIPLEGELLGNCTGDGFSGIQRWFPSGEQVEICSIW